jgi:hypothetical protein
MPPITNQVRGPKGITAMAHRLARLVLSHAEVRSANVDKGMECHDEEIAQPTNPIAPQEGYQTRAAARARAGLTYVSEEREKLLALSRGVVRHASDVVQR